MNVGIDDMNEEKICKSLAKFTALRIGTVHIYDAEAH